MPPKKSVRKGKSKKQDSAIKVIQKQDSKIKVIQYVPVRNGGNMHFSIIIDMLEVSKI